MAFRVAARSGRLGLRAGELCRPGAMRRLSGSSSSKGDNKQEYGSFIEEWRKFKMPAALGVGCLVLLSLKRHYTNPTEFAAPKPPQDKEIDFGAPWSPWSLKIVESLPPYRWMSNLWGKMASTHLPDPIKLAVYNAWTILYNCQLHEMRFPFEHYASLSEFFLRPLKDGVRAIDADSPETVVSPVDARVLHVASVDLADADQLCIESVKGNTYKVNDFVGRFPEGLGTGAASTKRGSKSRKLQTIVLYLAPGDYHHFHSPADWTILQRRHFGGTLLPVRPWAVKYVQDLYVKNERVVLNGEWQGGFFSFGAVGALNVGSIDILWDKDLVTNQNASVPYAPPPVKCSQRDYPIPVDQVRGQPVGSFNLGSTIVLVFESSESFTFSVKSGQVVRVGQRLGTEHALVQQRPPTMAPPWPGSDSTNLLTQKLEDIRRET